VCYAKNQANIFQLYNRFVSCANPNPLSFNDIHRPYPMTFEHANNLGRLGQLRVPALSGVFSRPRGFSRVAIRLNNNRKPKNHGKHKEQQECHDRLSIFVASATCFLPSSFFI
jgi:hypothetical protein